MQAPPAAKPRYEHIAHPTVEEIENGLRQWARQRPNVLRVEVPGRSPEGLPVLLCTITDAGVPDDDKQIALITTCHAGRELNTATGALRLIKWLISDEAEARRIRRRQVVLVMPVCDPEGFERHQIGNSLGHSPYGAWALDGVREPEKSPEAVAIKAVIDEHMPEVHCDMHGVWYGEQTMWESTGISWASGLCRPYVHEFSRLIDRQAEEEGFLVTRGEQDAGQVRATAPVEGGEHHFYLQRAGVNDCVYSYRQYHTLAFTLEAGFEESIIARVRAMLELGHRRWRGEPHHGYPVNQVGCWTSAAIAAWGTTATQRRHSRVELWRKLDQLRFGCGHPEPRGTIMAFCATNARGALYLEPEEIGDILDGLEDVEGFDLPALRQFSQRTPAERVLPTGAGNAGEPMEHGLAIRLLIPHRECRIRHLALDGRPVALSRTRGYQLWRNPGTIVQVNIPPGEVGDLHIVTCAYEEHSGRRSGFHAEDWRLA
ncbi:MAG: M14 family zinc carboxypeptidase [Armatimonadota bacterium]